MSVGFILIFFVCHGEVPQMRQLKKFPQRHRDQKSKCMLFKVSKRNILLASSSNWELLDCTAFWEHSSHCQGLLLLKSESPPFPTIKETLRYSSHHWMEYLTKSTVWAHNDRGDNLPCRTGMLAGAA